MTEYLLKLVKLNCAGLWHNPDADFACQDIILKKKSHWVTIISFSIYPLPLIPRWIKNDLALAEHKWF